MRVLFIRHAIAQERFEFDGDDFYRPLSDKGGKKATQVFKILKKVYHNLDLIVSSPLIRAKQTAIILSKAFDDTKIIYDERLIIGSYYVQFKDLIKDLDFSCESIAIIGHEPDFSQIVSEIVSNGHLNICVKKASCIEIEMGIDGRGELINILTPKVLLKCGDENV